VGGVHVLGTLIDRWRRALETELYGSSVRGTRNGGGALLKKMGNGKLSKWASPQEPCWGTWRGAHLPGALREREMQEGSFTGDPEGYAR